MDGARAWSLCLAGAISNSIVLGCSYTYGLFLPKLLEEFKEGRARTALAGSFAIAASGFFGPIVGKLSDRFGCRIVTTFGGLLCSLGLLLTSFAPNMTIMYISFGLLYGFGGCCVYNSVFVVVPSYFYKRRALAIGLIAAGPGAGVFVMTPIIHNLINAVGWRKTFMVLAGIVAPISLTGCWFAPYKDPEQLAVEEPKIEHKRDCNFKINNIFNVSIWKIPTFTVITLSRAVAHIGELTPVTHMARHCKDLGFTASDASRLYLYYGLTCLVSRVAFGRMCDISWVNPHYVYRGALLVAGLSTLLFPLAKTFVYLLLYFVVIGLTDGSIATPFNLMIVTSLDSRQRAQGYGFCMFVICSVAITAPALAGFLADELGSYDPAFFLAGTAELLAALVTFALHFWKEPGKKDTCCNHSKEEVAFSRLMVVQRETVL